MEALPYIDKTRTAAAGASYGGFMMAWLNGHTDRFKAMVCHAGVYNWHSMMASDFVRGRERPAMADRHMKDHAGADRVEAGVGDPFLGLGVRPADGMRVGPQADVEEHRGTCDADRLGQASAG